MTAVEGAQQEFAWYEALPEGVECRMRSKARSRRAASFYLHRLPSRTGTIVDYSPDPVVSVALNPRGTIERQVEGRWESAAIGRDNLTLTPACAECQWRWLGDPLDILDVYVPLELIQQTSLEHFRIGCADVNFLPKLVLTEQSIALLIRSMLHALPLGGAHADLLRETMTFHLVVSLLSHQQRVFSWRGDGVRALPTPVLKRVQAYVEDNIGAAISLQSMAEVARMSRFHFLRLFRESTGLTPYGYVTERRMARGRELLSTSDLPIGEVAAACGFDDPSYFSACFRQRYGQTPRQFRLARH